MTRITAVINQKGGVGKTTTAHALATGLIHRGYNVLVVDADPQGNLSYSLNANTEQPGLYEAMKGEDEPLKIIQTTKQGDIIASSIYLAGADMEFTASGREYRIKETIESVNRNSKYDHIIIDCPPALGILTINALTACNDVVVPIGADIFSLQGLQQLLNTINTVRKYSNNKIKLAGLLITRKSNRAIATRQLIEAIEKNVTSMEAQLYKIIIREGVAVKETQIMQSSLFDSHTKAKVTADYNAFIDEYLAQE